MNEPSRPSKKQHELWSFIAEFIATHGYGPSYREIQTALGYKSVSTVAVHVNNLVAKGALRRRNRSARSLEVARDLGSGQTDPNAEISSISPSDAKWLIDQVNARFARAEASLDAKSLDELYVLTGALTILGLDGAATAAKSRLLALKRTLD